MSDFTKVQAVNQKNQSARRVFFKTAVKRKAFKLAGGLAGCKGEKYSADFSRQEKVSYLKECGIANPTEKQIESLSSRYIYQALSNGLIRVIAGPKCPEQKSVETKKDCPPAGYLRLRANPAEVEAGVTNREIMVDLRQFSSLKQNEDVAIDLSTPGINKQKPACGITISDRKIDYSRKLISFKLSVSRKTTPDDYRFFILSLNSKNMATFDITVKQAAPNTGDASAAHGIKHRPKAQPKTGGDAQPKAQPKTGPADNPFEL